MELKGLEESYVFGEIMQSGTWPKMSGEYGAAIANANLTNTGLWL
jgi:hypothetical protein